MDNRRKLEYYTTRCIEHKILDFLVGVFEHGKLIDHIYIYEHDDAVLGAYYTENDVYYRIVSKKKYNANENDFFAHVIFEKDEPTHTYQWGAKELASLIFAELKSELYDASC